MTATPATLADAREQFLALVEDVRPELHRYCARLTGSVIEGEDIVQEALAKAFYALSQSPDLPALRPWLFRITHNAAIDFLKSHSRKYTDTTAEFEDVASFEERPDPAIVRAALARFLTLPVAQRSAVILKDVLGHSLEETAETMGISVMAVKAALVRGRGKLLERETAKVEAPAPTHSDLDRYAGLFNKRDWDGLRALVSADCRLDLVGRTQRRGKAVGVYFERYEKQNVRVQVVRLEGRLVLAGYDEAPPPSVGAMPPGERAVTPGYFILLEFEDRQVKAIRDFRYVTYIAAEAEIESVDE